MIHLNQEYCKRMTPWQYIVGMKGVKVHHDPIAHGAAVVRSGNKVQVGLQSEMLGRACFHQGRCPLSHRQAGRASRHLHTATASNPWLQPCRILGRQAHGCAVHRKFDTVAAASASAPLPASLPEKPSQGASELRVIGAGFLDSVCVTDCAPLFL